jgi:hypothetical protein
MKSFFAWIGRGIGNVRGLFPFTREGRQTLIYLTLAGCGPALTGVVIWAMHVIETFPDADAAQRLDKFADLAFIIGAGLLIITVALACFVSIRAIKIGRDGLEATGGEEAAAGAQFATDAAQAATEELKP